MKIKRSKSSKIVFGSVVLFYIFFCFNTVHAAEISLAASSSAVTENQSVQVTMVLNTQGADANAIQAQIFFPSNIFKLQTITDGDSVVSLWITPPKESAPGEIDFAGIMPGGFTGASGKILSFTLQPLATGSGAITIATTTLLENNGMGSSIPTTVINTAVAVSSSSGSYAPIAPHNDYIAPDPFTPIIATATDIYNGKYFLVFNTTDNASGIDHYEVLEVPTGASEQPFSSWHVAVSPYLLTDQSLSSDIYVRAVDHNGNFIVVKLPARYPRSSHLYTPWSIILPITIVLLLLLWTQRRRIKAWVTFR
jgi:hypothetical protein